jgi:hypothetical protein
MGTPQRMADDASKMITMLTGKKDPLQWLRDRMAEGIKGSTDAYLSNSSVVKAVNSTSAVNLKVNSFDDSYIIAIGGAVGVGQDGAVGAALGYNEIGVNADATEGATSTPIRKCSSFVARPPDRLPAAMTATPSNAGTSAAAISSVTWLAAAISEACPARPKPVMSVQACASDGAYGATASAAARFSVRIDSIASAAAARSIRSNFNAVATMPVPSGLVRKRTSPGFAPALVRMRSGSIAPVTAYQDLGICPCDRQTAHARGRVLLLEPALKIRA